MEQYYKLTSKEVIEKLKSCENGLNKEDANQRLISNGLNKLKEVKKKSLISKFVDQFKNVMIIILIISAILSAIVSFKTGEPLTDTIIILFVVFLNALLGIIQEAQAEKAIEALKNMSLPYIKVKRDDNVLSIKTEELVVGDIVLLEAGDYVPADMRIIVNHSLRVEEAALTGESVAVDKTDEVIVTEKKLVIADRVNMLYSGSSVVYGRAEAIVVSVGMDTQLGKIAESISNQKVEITPLQKKMNELSRVLSIIIVIIACIMVLVGYLKGNPIIDVFMLAISLAVAAIPEGLSTVITITLAIGVQKMAKEKAIVRKLSSVEALGATEVICSDKTGTLTQNKMSVRKIYLNSKLTDVTEFENFNDVLEKGKLIKKDLEILTNICILCNDTKFGEDKGSKIMLGDPTETALIDFSSKMGKDKEQMEKEYERVDELPFDSTRKMMTTVNKIENEYFISTKGAVESILNNCNEILKNGKIEKITVQDREEIIKNNLIMAQSALRVLAFAYKSNSKEIEIKENDLIFVGLVGMIDPPRKEAKTAVEKCFNAGMIPVMITGDNIDTAIAIAKELGILKKGNEAITGEQLDLMSDELLAKNVNNIRVYARVSPENKVRIVKAWKANKKVVAMTGDGVNDAPALKIADIGVGMGITGTEVSKSVSSMIISDDNFATIIVAIKEGRRIYNNIQNAIAYLLASNLAEVIIIFIATLIDKTLLLPIQILWINLVTDTIPAIALGFEKEEKAVMRQKPRNSQENFFNLFLISRILVPGILKAIIIFIMYFMLERTHGEDVARGAIFITFAIIEILFAFVCRSDRKSVFKIGFLSNKPMIFCIVGTLALQILIMINPIFSNWLKVPPFTSDVYIIIGVFSLAAVMIFECIKLILAEIFLNKNIKNKS